MRKIVLYSVCLVAILALGSAIILPMEIDKANSDGTPLSLTFIANEGVLIESPTKKVLIDALFDNPNPAYPAPPVAILEKMFDGQSPFDHVDLVLVTHNHPDHMNVVPLIRFMKRNPDVRLIIPKDAVEELQVAPSEWEKIKDRVMAVDIDLNTAQKMKVEGIVIEVFRTQHSGELERPWNLMYLLNMEGRTVFHEGDFDGRLETFARLGLQNREVDLALVHFWFPLNEVGVKLIQESLKPEHIGLFHLPLRLYEDAPLKIDMIKKNYTDIFLLKECMEKRVFN